MPNAYISGTGMCMPDNVVTNNDLRDVYGIDTDHEWIHQRTGINERRFAPAGVGPSDLALVAAEQAFASAGIDKSDIELIIFCTLTPEYPFPGAGCFLQEKLELPGVPALDVRNQCSGFLYGLATASSMIKAGLYKTILLVGAEIHSAGMDLNTSGRSVACLFGDGAGAVIVSATDDESRGVQWLNLGADGKYKDALYAKTWDARKRPFIDIDENGNGIVPPSDLWPQMNGKLVFKNAVEKMIGSLVAMAWEKGIEIDDLDLVFFHQANLRINQYVQEQLKIPDDKVPTNIARYGNTTAATIPTLLAECERDGRLKPGMKVAMVAFGSGFTWGSAYVIW